jgi:aldose 1-epimerase
MSISVAEWGSINGTPVQLWTLVTTAGMRMRVTNYGTIITELHVPGRDGALVDVALGRPSLQDYVERTQYFGCTAGRCANRICKGQFRCWTYCCFRFEKLKRFRSTPASMVCSIKQQ